MTREAMEIGTDKNNAMETGTITCIPTEGEENPATTREEAPTRAGSLKKTGTENIKKKPEQTGSYA